VFALLSEVVYPTHALSVPEMIAGCGLTVTVETVKQPEPIVYVIFAVPGVKPLTIPLVAPTVAIAVLLLVHETIPGVALAKELVVPTHTAREPVDGAGDALTVNMVVV
jgi:hypothetical protein